jgi:catechol 2,3-dioxygenase
MTRTSTLADIGPRLTTQPGTRIGDVHLKVFDLDRAFAFHCGVLGFALKQGYGRQAAFVAGAYYHHVRPQHLADPRRRAAAARFDRPLSFGDPYPRRAPLADALRRLIQAKVPLDGISDHGISEALDSLLAEPGEDQQTTGETA